jgi:hypothetical protein
MFRAAIAWHWHACGRRCSVRPRRREERAGLTLFSLYRELNVTQQ